MRLPPIGCHLQESNQGLTLNVNECEERIPCEILPHMLIGQTGFPCLDDVDHLRRLGIYYLVNCGKSNHIERIRKTYHNGKVKAIYLNLDDSSKQDLSLVLDFVLPLIHRAKLENRKCLVHCKNCMSRAVSIAVAYLIKYEKMTLIQAMSLVKGYRREVSPNPGFMKQLITFELLHQSKLAARRGGQPCIPTVDINLYRMDRFGEPYEYAAEQKESSSDANKTGKTKEDYYKRNLRH
mmetsp:Transcript_19146/g.26545  ORF Transcript_19146/g.26545 Transcript_19146/m.26545 type:complete len:237 (+) Transcript_19146:175-885(+)